MMIEFTIYGKPEPQGSSRAFLPKGHTRPVITSDNKSIRTYRREVTTTAIEAMKDHELIARPLSVSMDVEFYLKRPASLPKKYNFHSKKPDLSKLIRALEDGLTGVLFDDDSQIDNIVAHKYYGNPERTVVRAWASDPHPPAVPKAAKIKRPAGRKTPWPI